MRRKNWTTKEVEILRQDYPDTSTKVLAERFSATVDAVYRKAWALGLKKSAKYLASPAACRLRRGDNVGKAFRFRPGHKPHNTGKKGWQAGGNARKTQFRPGHRGGKAAALYRPIGAERITKDGYLQRKMNDDMPLQRRWKMVHNLIWEEANGPIPKSHIVVFLNGNKQDLRLDNLELISRKENMRRNTIHRYPPELKSTIRLAGKLRRAIDEKQD